MSALCANLDLLLKFSRTVPLQVLTLRDGGCHLNEDQGAGSGAFFSDDDQDECERFSTSRDPRIPGR